MMVVAGTGRAATLLYNLKNNQGESDEASDHCLRTAVESMLDHVC